MINKIDCSIRVQGLLQNFHARNLVGFLHINIILQQKYYKLQYVSRHLNLQLAIKSIELEQ